MDTTRCTAAHDEDPTPCIGPKDAVTIVDKLGTAVPACENHGATLLASLYDGRAEPGTVPGAATRVFAAADTTHPFPWLADALRTEPGQLSNAANRAADQDVDADAPRDPKELEERLEAEAAEYEIEPDLFPPHLWTNDR
ncbi:hypothetical protein [Streptomyces antimicrobicus]|uniref:Uncharacterized protein n=1 Tax=Streptomyces antimicrobicus TaxID=2883108 RepID=A0ABS8BE18_9ACTN|nr:hypothetical protein [Streptomyces antimicrobicus]MCB5182865.1 hypothetical protein [Streptomyces antimicrobicus]